MASRLAVLLGAALLAGTACTGTGVTARESPPLNDETEESRTPGEDGLLSRIEGGGLTIVFRHAATDQAQPDDPTVDLTDCDTQRNLSRQGRADAKLIGNSFRQLKVRVGQVWASPYCRSRDTAELAFGRAEVVNGLERLYPDLDEEADQRLNGLIREQAPRDGEPNLIIAGHGVYPSVLSPAAGLAEGEAAIYARSGDGFRLVDRMDPAEWAGLDDSGDDPNAVAERVLESVVSIHSEDRRGSAFRVAVPGILVTNAHLVAGATEVTVILQNGTQRTAEVVGLRPSVDIAALRVDDSGLPPLHSGTGLADARVGDPVLAIGAPRLVASGSIQGLSEPTAVASSTELAAVRVNAEVSPATSGGPLVDSQGYVLGVLTTSTTVRDAVAIPVDVARDAALDIVRDS